MILFAKIAFIGMSGYDELCKKWRKKIKQVEVTYINLIIPLQTNQPDGYLIRINKILL